VAPVLLALATGSVYGHLPAGGRLSIIIASSFF
jgi:hypothetical protein